MKKLVYYLTAFILVLFAGACSSSNKDPAGDEAPPEELPAADAGTDAVPADAQKTAEMASANPPASPPPPIAPPTDTAAAPPPAPSTAPDLAAAQPPAQPAPAEPAAAPPATPPAPAAEAAPATPPAAVASGSGDFQDYTVRSGETLMKIAFETYGDLYKWRDIYEANRDRIGSPNSIPAGTVLKLEKSANPVTVERNGDKYLIKWGDTLGSISYDIYGMRERWKKLWENNRQLIHDPNKIFAGFYLYYVITPEERDQAEKLKNQQPMAPKPLAESSEENRAMSSIPSATAPAPAAAPAQPQANSGMQAPPANTGGAEPLPQAPVAAAPAQGRAAATQ